MINAATKAKIIDAARIEEVVGDFVKLKRASSNYQGLCPFHNEKTPSFVVSPAKNLYKCFGCGKAGNPITFVMEHEKLLYNEALRWLAQRYQITIEEEVKTDEAFEKQKEKDSLFIVAQFAQKFYSEALQTEEGKEIALSYFRERGLTDATISKFGLGWADKGWDTLYSYANQQGYKSLLMQKVGLIVYKNEKYFDFFRERIIFPIHGPQGKVLAFAGRILKKTDKGPKYINSPETEIYNKSQTLYGLHLAKNSIIKQDMCYLVEGYLDVISLHQFGIENVVASSGTSLTSAQVQLIRRYSKNITILYDGDSAGIKAALRGIDLILQEGMQVKVLLFDTNEDPDSYVQKNGAEALISKIENESKDFILFKTQLLKEEHKNDPIKKTTLVNDIVASIACIPEALPRNIYIQQCSMLLGVNEQILVNEVNKLIRNNIQSQNQNLDLVPIKEVDENEILDINIDESNQLKKTNALAIIEKQLMILLIESANKQTTWGKTVGIEIMETLDGQEFEDAFAESIFLEAKKMWLQSQLFPIVNFYTYHENATFADQCIDLLLNPFEYSPNWKLKLDIITLSPEENFNKNLEKVIILYSIRKIEKLLTENKAHLKMRNDWQQTNELIEKQMILTEMKKKYASQLNIVTTK